MRVVIGGAYNGKKAYVKKALIGTENYQWFEGSLPADSAEKVVLTGIEKWLAKFAGDEKTAIQHVLDSVENRKSIVILTDISRGIVPMDPKERELRDRCGRLYQALTAQADEVIQIWYGIPKKIK